MFISIAEKFLIVGGLGGDGDYVHTETLDSTSFEAEKIILNPTKSLAKVQPQYRRSANLGLRSERKHADLIGHNESDI